MSKKKTKTFQQVLNMFPTTVNLYNGAAQKQLDPKKEFYFGCNWKDNPCIVIQWSEKGRGFGEYTFYEEKGKLYCNNEMDDKWTVMRVMCQLVQKAIFTEVHKEKKKCSVLKVTSNSKSKSTTTKSQKSPKDS